MSTNRSLSPPLSSPPSPALSSPPPLPSPPLLVQVPVDLSLSAHANASAYFDTRRRHLAKHGKTVAANQAALAAAEKKAEAQLKQVGLLGRVELRCSGVRWGCARKPIPCGGVWVCGLRRWGDNNVVPVMATGSCLW